MAEQLATLGEKTGKVVVEFRLPGAHTADAFPQFVTDRNNGKPEDPADRKRRLSAVRGAPLITIPSYRVFTAPGLLEKLEGAGLQMGRISFQAREDDSGPFTILSFTFAPPGNFLKRLLGLAEATPAGGREYFKERTSGKFGYLVVCERHMLVGADKGVLFHFASPVKRVFEVNVESELGFGLQVLVNPEVAANEAKQAGEAVKTNGAELLERMFPAPSSKTA